MWRSKLLAVSMMVLLMFTVTIHSPTVEARTSPAAPSHEHRLLRGSDVAEFGNIVAYVPEGSVNDRFAVDPRPVQGWIEGRNTDFVISAKDSDVFVAMINHTSYLFLSERAAALALASLPDPVTAYSWESVVQDDLAMLDSQELSLAGSSWRTWRGIDDEGMPAYVLWLQHDAYVSEIHINVLDEAIGQQLFPLVIAKMTGKLLGSSSATGTVPSGSIPVTEESIGSFDIINGRQHTALTATAPDPQSQWWLPDSRAGSFEFPCCWHVLAVWSLPQGHNPHFHGAGGDATTCVNNGGHGCISQWVWWLQNPNSKLGIPKTWYSTNFQNGSGNSNNYSATVWVQ